MRCRVPPPKQSVPSPTRSVRQLTYRMHRGLASVPPPPCKAPPSSCRAPPPPCGAPRPTCRAASATCSIALMTCRALPATCKVLSPICNSSSLLCKGLQPTRRTLLPACRGFLHLEIFLPIRLLSDDDMDLYHRRMLAFAVCSCPRNLSVRLSVGLLARGARCDLSFLHKQPFWRCVQRQLVAERV